MDISEIVPVIEKYAPLLSSALGCPIAGISGTVMTLIAHIFNADSKNPTDIAEKIQSDPQAEIKLKQIEIDHEDFLLKTKNDSLAMEYEDRREARNLEQQYVAKNGHTSFMITFLVIMLFFGIIGCIYCIINYNTIVGETIAFLLGTMREEMKSVYAMYFGGKSSVGDKNVHRH